MGIRKMGSAQQAQGITPDVQTWAPLVSSWFGSRSQVAVRNSRKERRGDSRLGREPGRPGRVTRDQETAASNPGAPKPLDYM